MRKILNNGMQLNTSVEIEDLEYIDNLGYENRISRSQLARNIIVDFIKNHKQEARNG